MAVQQNKKSPSRRGHRRSHGALSPPALSTDSLTGELHRRHHITKDGYYRGKKILAAVVNPLPEKKIIIRKPKADKAGRAQKVEVAEKPAAPNTAAADAKAESTSADNTTAAAVVKDDESKAATAGEGGDAKGEGESKSATGGN